jgi:hypothetical protein
MAWERNQSASERDEMLWSGLGGMDGDFAGVGDL